MSHRIGEPLGSAMSRNTDEEPTVIEPTVEHVKTRENGRLWPVPESTDSWRSMSPPTVSIQNV